LVIFDALSLEEKGQVTLDGPPIAGPFSIDNGCLVQTASKLALITNQGASQETLSWEIEFPKSILLGPPLSVPGGYLVTSQAGHIWLLDAETGQPVGKTDLGYTLSCPPLVTSAGLLVGSDEGAVLELPLPSAITETP
jgi:hypothetical protein